MKNLFRLLLTVVVALSVLQCRKMWDDVELEETTRDIAIPLLSTEIFFSDLITRVVDEQDVKDTLIFNADGTMILKYSGDVAGKKADEVFYFFKGNVPVPMLDTLYYLPFNVPDSVNIYRGELKSGGLQLYVWNTGETEPVTVTFSIPQMKKNGQVFSQTFVVPPGPPGGIFQYVLPAVSVADYQLTSTNDSIYFKYDARLPNGKKVKLRGATAGAPEIVALILNWDVKYMEGYWGRQVYELNRDTIDIDINAKGLRGNITIKDPKVTVNVENSFGFPTRGIVRFLRFIDKNGKEYELKSPQIFTGVDFDYPSLAAGEVGKIKYSSFAFDSTNSNIAEIFNAQPVKMIYEIDGLANAAGDPNLIGFITCESYVKFGVTVELLLEGTARDFGAEQTLDLNFNDLINNHHQGNMKEVEFKLVAENQMPVGTALQMYFQRADGQTLDSLFSGGITPICQPADVDAKGFPKGVKRTETFITLSRERFDRVKSARRVYLRTLFNTTRDARGNSVDVKMLSTSTTQIRMGARLKITN